MCTVSWRFHQTGQGGDSYDLIFNRDELKTRLPASPPALHHSPQGTRYICATDGNRGGTWLFVNNHGLTAGLLNYYDAQARQPDEDTGIVRSRGHLVLSLVDSDSVPRLIDALQSSDLNAYRPFHLFALAPGGVPAAATWDGHRLTLISDAGSLLPMTTSSFESERVVAHRKELFRSIAPETVNSLEAYHRSFDPDQGARSVCMMRPDAQTWSISHIRVDQSSIRYDYEDRDRDVLDFKPVVSCHLARS